MTSPWVGAALVATLFAPSTTACAEQVAPKSSIAADVLPPIAFATSAVHDALSALGRRYEVWVDLPPSYAQSTKPLPVVFVLDPHWALPVTRSLHSLIDQRGRNLEDFILVGLSHDQDSGLEGQRRDLTPTDLVAIPRTHRATGY